MTTAARLARPPLTAVEPAMTADLDLDPETTRRPPRFVLIGAAVYVVIGILSPTVAAVLIWGTSCGGRP